MCTVNSLFYIYFLIWRALDMSQRSCSLVAALFFCMKFHLYDFVYPTKSNLILSNSWNYVLIERWAILLKARLFHQLVSVVQSIDCNGLQQQWLVDVIVSEKLYLYFFTLILIVDVAIQRKKSYQWEKFVRKIKINFFFHSLNVRDY